MDLSRLQPGIRDDPRPLIVDTPPFRTRMLRFVDPDCLATALDAPVTPSEFRRLLHRGSAATALDELPRPLLQHLPAHGLGSCITLLTTCYAPPQSALLLTALHLPLRKTEPAWLLRNSRPVLLQPYLRRLEATAVFQRLVHRLEERGLLPSEMFAYRPQLSAQQAGLLVTGPPRPYPPVTPTSPGEKPSDRAKGTPHASGSPVWVRVRPPPSTPVWVRVRPPPVTSGLGSSPTPPRPACPPRMRGPHPITAGARRGRTVTPLADVLLAGAARLSLRRRLGRE